MKISKLTPLFLIGGLLIRSIASFAAEVENSQEETSIVQSSTDKTSLSGNAKDWNLTDSEWTQYHKIMQGSAGFWYRQLPPPAVLDMYTDDSEDTKHFAEVYAKQEHQKVERELAFNKAAFQAAKRLYPNEPMINPFDMRPFNPIKGK
jgi:integrating conjugative element protein (TIGR03759 family)